MDNKPIPDYARADADRPFTPLHTETRTAVPTDCAAFHLNREPQTLRLWSMSGSGPLRPLRINGRLAWPVAAIKRLLEVA